METIQMLDGTDFRDELENDIRLNRDECLLLLIYFGNDQKTQKTIEIFTSAAGLVPAPNFYLLDLSYNRGIAKRFKALESSTSPFRWAYLRALPVIMVYSNGNPQAFYNGERSIKSLSEYALTMACRPEYYEPVNVFGGVETDKDDSVELPPTYVKQKSSMDIGKGSGDQGQGSNGQSDQAQFV